MFNDIYHKQIDGVAMGSPSGPIFVNLFLVYYEYKWSENCPISLNLSFIVAMLTIYS